MTTDSTILALDQGTTSSRAMLFGTDGSVKGLEQQDLPLKTPHSGWVEQDGMQIVRDTLSCAEALIKDTKPAAIGITNQRETTLIWDRETGKPIYNAIVWQDRRTAGICEELKTVESWDEIPRRNTAATAARPFGRPRGGVEQSETAVSDIESEFTNKTGLLLDPYFSATKIAWILDHVDGARARAEAGKLAFGTVETWLIWHLSGGQVHKTDATNAARTALMNIQTGEWDEELLRLFRIPEAVLPEIVDNTHDFGTWNGIPIAASVGDQQGASVGQACFEPGMMKSTYGTGCFALVTIGPNFKQSENRLLTTIASRINGHTEYALEGSIFVAGAAIQFLRDNLGFFEKSSETEAMALSVPDSDGVVFVPALTGLGAPYWNPDVRGAIFGLSRGTTPAHITRAALEAQAYQTRDLMDAMRADSGVDIDTMRVDGGLVANNFVCQTLADETGCRVERPVNTECTAWGAASLAMIQKGLADQASLSTLWRGERVFKPDPSADSGYGHWQKAVAALIPTK